jgi:hypothetical protein
MLRKQKCSRCGEKISGKYEFCPYCGNHIDKENKEDWGMLGKNDFMQNNQANPFGIPPGLNSIFNFLMKNLNNQFDNLDKEAKKGNKTGISISISNSGEGPPKISVNQMGNSNQNKEKKVKIKEAPSKTFSEENIKKFQNLSRKEPETEMRRFSDKIVYEVKLPGVVSINDVSIVKLENSIEIRAVAKSKAYSKIIPINLPILNYILSKGKLVLELKA